jgi:hypothetical protein
MTHEKEIKANMSTPETDTTSGTERDTLVAPPANSRPRGSSCASCGAAQTDGVVVPSFVYVIGRLSFRFPRLAVEKEFAQVAARSDAAGLTDHQTLHKILSDSQNRYLVRQLCWVMTVAGLETYIVRPRDPGDFALLVQALRPTPKPTDLDVLIGVRGSVAPPEMCNGLVLPVVGIDHTYSFDRESLIKAIPRPKTISQEHFAAAAEELLDRIMGVADNAGATDEHRALNYLVVRYPAIYANAAAAFARNASLSAVEVRSSPLSGVRKILDVILSYTDRTTDVTEKVFVRVDVSDEFPFLVTKLSPYFDR